jgi:hypothetical protein
MFRKYPALNQAPLLALFFILEGIFSNDYQNERITGSVSQPLARCQWEETAFYSPQNFYQQFAF